MQWDVPSHRIRAYVRAVRRTGTPKGSQPSTLRLKRAHADIKAGNQGIFRAHLLLNDFSPRGLMFSSARRLEVGRTITLTLEIPDQFYAQAVVTGCLEDPGSGFRVLQANPSRYRVHVEFIFQSAIEEQMAQSFWSQVQCFLLDSN